MARLYRSSHFSQLSQTHLAKAYITWLLHTGPIHKRSVATSQHCLPALHVSNNVWDFLNINGDLAFVFFAMLSSCTLISLSFSLLSVIIALSLLQPFLV